MRPDLQAFARLLVQSLSLVEQPIQTCAVESHQSACLLVHDWGETKVAERAYRTIMLAGVNIPPLLVGSMNMICIYMPSNRHIIDVPLIGRHQYGLEVSNFMWRWNQEKKSPLPLVLATCTRRKLAAD